MHITGALPGWGHPQALLKDKATWAIVRLAPSGIGHKIVLLIVFLRFSSHVSKRKVLTQTGKLQTPVGQSSPTPIGANEGEREMFAGLWWMYADLWWLDLHVLGRPVGFSCVNWEEWVGKEKSLFYSYSSVYPQLVNSLVMKIGMDFRAFEHFIPNDSLPVMRPHHGGAEDRAVPEWSARTRSLSSTVNIAPH